MNLQMAAYPSYQSAPVAVPELVTYSPQSSISATTTSTLTTTTLPCFDLLKLTAAAFGIGLFLLSKHFMKPVKPVKPVPVMAIQTGTNQDTTERKKNKDDPETHPPWTNLNSYRGKTKKGVTSKKNEYYYEKDYTHGDVQVYKKVGSKGVHIGSVSMKGGQLTKASVPGRTINL